MKKHVSNAYLLAFLFLFIMPTVLFKVFGSFFDTTNYENRSIAEKPVFSLSCAREFPGLFESYYNDTMPFRTQLIEANSLIDFFVFQKSPVDMVVAGKDGWLFYNNLDDGDPMGDFTGKNCYSDEQLKQIAGNLTAARDRLREMGKRFVIFIAPNKACIYGRDYLPPSFQSENDHSKGDLLVDYLQQHTDLTVVYPKEALMAAKDTNLLYFRHDTHWNATGAYIGSCELMKTLGYSMPPLDELTAAASGTHAGDLANMMGLSKYLTQDDLYILSGYADEANLQHSFPVEGDANLEQFTSSNLAAPSVFVVRDSFALSMYPYLNPHFSSSFYVHHSAYSPELLLSFPSDVVVLEVVERYTHVLEKFTVE